MSPILFYSTKDSILHSRVPIIHVVLRHNDFDNFTADNKAIILLCSQIDFIIKRCKPKQNMIITPSSISSWFCVNEEEVCTM